VSASSCAVGGRVVLALSDFGDSVLKIIKRCIIHWKILKKITITFHFGTNIKKIVIYE